MRGRGSARPSTSAGASGSAAGRSRGQVARPSYSRDRTCAKAQAGACSVRGDRPAPDSGGVAGPAATRHQPQPQRPVVPGQQPRRRQGPAQVIEALRPPGQRAGQRRPRRFFSGRGFLVRPPRRRVGQPEVDDSRQRLGPRRRLGPRLHRPQQPLVVFGIGRVERAGGTTRGVRLETGEFVPGGHQHDAVSRGQEVAGELRCYPGTDVPGSGPTVRGAERRGAERRLGWAAPRSASSSQVPRATSRGAGAAASRQTGR